MVITGNYTYQPATPVGVTQSMDGATTGVSLSPRMGRLQGCHSVLGWGTTGVSLSPRMGRLQGCHSVLGWGDYRGVTQSWDGATTGVSLSPGMGRLQGCHSVLGWGDYRGVTQSWDGATTGVSLSPRMGRLQGCHLVLGWGDYRGDMPSALHTLHKQPFPLSLPHLPMSLVNMGTSSTTEHHYNHYITRLVPTNSMRPYKHICTPAPLHTHTPEKPDVPLARICRSTSGDSFTLAKCTLRMSWRALTSGRVMTTRRSNRPGRMSALQERDGRRGEEEVVEEGRDTNTFF